MTRAISHNLTYVGLCEIAQFYVFFASYKLCDDYLKKIAKALDFQLSLSYNI